MTGLQVDVLTTEEQGRPGCQKALETMSWSKQKREDTWKTERSTQDFVLDPHCFPVSCMSLFLWWILKYWCLKKCAPQPLNSLFTYALTDLNQLLHHFEKLQSKTHWIKFYFKLSSEASPRCHTHLQTFQYRKPVIFPNKASFSLVLCLLDKEVKFCFCFSMNPCIQPSFLF